MKYGLPYKGSKNKIAEWVLSVLPSAECLVDVFAGGCAITHCALLSGKYKKVIANDLDIYPSYFKKCCEGGAKNEKRWISREDFFKLKDIDPYASICFSFGNDNRTYAYSKELEPYKKAVHEMCFSDSPFEIKRKYRKVVREMVKLSGNQRLECLQSLESLERIERIERLERLERLEVSQTDYRELIIPEESVIYCDPPYVNSGKYKHDLKHDEFYQWALEQNNPIFISEYDMPEDFVCIAEKQKTCHFAPTNNKMNTTEKIFIPRHQYEKVI